MCSLPVPELKPSKERATLFDGTKSWLGASLLGTRALACWLALLSVACGSVDPSSDFQETSALVAARSGLELVPPVPSSPTGKPQDARIALKQELLQGGLTLDEALRLALACNAGLRASLFGIAVSKADLVQAGLAPNPSLSLSGYWARGSLYQLGGSFMQPLLGLLLIPAKKRAAAGRLSVAKLGVAQGAVSLLADVRAAFFEALSRTHALALEEESTTQARHLVELVERRFKAGLTTPSGLKLAQAELLVARRGLLSARLMRRLAFARLRGLLGLARDSSPLTLSGKLPLPKHLPPDAALRRLALRSRLELRAKAAAIEAAAADLSQTKLGVLPKLSLGLTHQRDEAGVNAQGPSLSLTLPVWDQNRAQVAKSGYRLSRLRAEQEALRDRVATEVLSGTLAVRGRGKLLQLLQEVSLPFQEELLRAARRSFQSGRGGVPLLTRAQRSLLDVRRAYAGALAAYAQALVQLQRALAGAPEEASK